jgi:drug/metabolite transporter (DMT)-like permease
MPRDRTVLAGTLAAVVAACLFGLLGPLARFGAEAGVDGVAFTAWRAALGVLFLGALIVLRGTARTSVAAIRGLSPAGKASLALAAAMGLTLNASVFTAFGLIPIALALMLFYTYPAGVVVVDVALGRERVTPSRVLALLLSSAGVVLVLVGGGTGDPGTAPVNALGIVLGLCAAASQVVFVTVSRTGYRAVPADAATLVILTTSAVGGVLIALVAGQAPGLVEPLRSLEAWPFIVLAGVAAAGLSSLLFLTAIRLIGGTRTGILMLLEPVVGAVLAGLLLGEALGPLQLVGGGLVLLGALVLQVRSDPRLEPIVEEGASPVV